jgi:hypothetical protein
VFLAFSHASAPNIFDDIQLMKSIDDGGADSQAGRFGTSQPADRQK